MRKAIARPIKVTRLPKDKDQQVDITVRAMIEITCVDAWNSDVRWLATHWRLPHFSLAETAGYFTAQIRRRVSFEFDPEDIELVRTPAFYAQAIRHGMRVSGDCDDMALLLGTLLYSIGQRIAYVVMATSPVKREFQHVFTALRVGNSWEYFDPSIAGGYSTDGLRRRWYYVPYGSGPPAI